MLWGRRWLLCDVVGAPLFALCVQVKVSFGMLKDTGIVQTVKAAKESIKYVAPSQRR
jgi:hypothetical protein